MAGNFLSNLNPDALMAISSGLLTGRTPAEQIGGALGGYSQVRKDQRQRNVTMDWLQKNSPDLLPMLDAGMSPADLLSLSYKQKREAEQAQLKAQQPQRQWVQLPDGQYGWADKNSGGFEPLGRFEKPRDMPAAADEYEYAKSQGFEGTFMDYQASKREKGGDKAPSGFRWSDESQTTLEPIPGGPGEQIAGELAARVGMADNFQKQLPAIRKKVAEGSVTGLLDRTIAGTGRGEQGEVYRQIQSGVDALQRLLTGAGMNVSEAQAYAQRYQPAFTDDAQTVLSKLDQLSAELDSTKNMAMRGRGGNTGGTQQTPKTGNRTSSGVQWSLEP